MKTNVDHLFGELLDELPVEVMGIEIKRKELKQILRWPVRKSRRDN
jgi:hypothetical protein